MLYRVPNMCWMHERIINTQCVLILEGLVLQVWITRHCDRFDHMELSCLPLNKCFIYFRSLAKDSHILSFYLKICTICLCSRILVRRLWTFVTHAWQSALIFCPNSFIHKWEVLLSPHSLLCPWPTWILCCLIYPCWFS